jgi:hypothetical protein
MEQAPTYKRFQLFAVCAIVIGVILVLSAFIGGISFVVALGRGIIGRTLKDVRTLVLDIVLEFCVPLVGGIVLIIAALKIMRHEATALDRQINTSTRKRVVKQKEKMLNVFLNDDEKKIVELIKLEKGGALQSDLVIKTGYSKVKMHRILKSLDNKGIVKRGRFGITNKVFVLN